MSDQDEIRSLLARYCFAIDSGDAAAYSNVFAPTGRWDGGPFGSFDGRDGALAFVRGAAADPKGFRHITSNAAITVDGDRASAKSYIQVYDQSGAAPALMFSGVYEDTLAKVDGEWLFDLRTLRMHPSEFTSAA